MKLKDIAKNLANRINQEHYLESELKKIYLKGFENGHKKGLEDSVKTNFNDLFKNFGSKK